MLARVLIIHRDDKRLEVQNQWTCVMSRSRDLAVQTTSDCRSEIAARSWDTTRTSVVSHAQCLVTLSEVIDRLQEGQRTRFRRCCGVTTAWRAVEKRSGSVEAERPTDPATSIEFANLLMKVAPATPSLCVSAPGDEVSLITLELKVTNDLSLRALIDCGASNNFVRRQSREGRRIKFVERDVPQTMMTVCLATCASITVEKRVVGIHYTVR